MYLSFLRPFKDSNYLKHQTNSTKTIAINQPWYNIPSLLTFKLLFSKVEFHALIDHPSVTKEIWYKDKFRLWENVNLVKGSILRSERLPTGWTAKQYLLVLIKKREVSCCTKTNKPVRFQALGRWESGTNNFIHDNCYPTPLKSKWPICSIIHMFESYS